MSEDPLALLNQEQLALLLEDLRQRVGDLQRLDQAAAGYPALSGLTLGQVLRATGAAAAAFGPLDLANASAVTGALPHGKGGIGTTGTPANGQVPVGNGAGFTLAALLGTANRVTVTNGAGTITLSGPQDLHTGASPTFVGLNLTGSIEQSTLLGAHAYHSANQSLTNNTLTALALNSERWDTDVIHDNTTNNSRLTCKTAGKYLIEGEVEYASHATGRRIAAIRLGGATYLAATQTSANATDVTALCCNVVYELAVNEYVELIGFQSSGGALNALASANHAPRLSMVRIP